MNYFTVREIQINVNTKKKGSELFYCQKKMHAHREVYDFQ